MDTLLQTDGQILLWIQEHIRQDWLTVIMNIITTIGGCGGAFWIGLCLILLCCKNTRLKGIGVSCSLAITFVLNNLILKNLVHRIRPYKVVEGLVLITKEPGDFSFPSGHTAAAFGTAVALCLLFPNRYGRGAVVLAFLIGLSRLYLGVHYPTDVLAGGIIGTAVAFIVTGIWKKKTGAEEKAKIEKTE